MVNFVTSVTSISIRRMGARFLRFKISILTTILGRYVAVAIRLFSNRINGSRARLSMGGIFGRFLLYFSVRSRWTFNYVLRGFKLYTCNRDSNDKRVCTSILFKGNANRFTIGLRKFRIRREMSLSGKPCGDNSSIVRFDQFLITNLAVCCRCLITLTLTMAAWGPSSNRSSSDCRGDYVGRGLLVRG